MIRLFTVIIFICFFLDDSFSQCEFTTDDTNKTFAEVSTCLADCGCQTIDIYSALTINENWNLVVRGDVVLTIKNGGSLIFTGSGHGIGEINMTVGSVIIIEDTNDQNALAATNQGQVRITIGNDVEFKGNQFDDLIAAGGADGNGPLPVELLSFEANQYANGVKVSWQTASELNNDYFTIERSRDGKSFSELTIVAGAGTTNQIQSYHFIDKKPFTGTSYYRLKQTDFDGSSETFRPVSVSIERPTSMFSFYPNPLVQDKLMLTSYVSALQIKIYNLHGQEIFNKDIGSTDSGYLNTELDLSHLPIGSYMVSLISSQEQYYTKLIKK